MMLINRLRDITKERLLELFQQADAARADLGGDKIDMAITFGMPGGETTNFEDFPGLECSLTISVHDKTS